MMGIYALVRRPTAIGLSTLTLRRRVRARETIYLVRKTTRMGLPWMSAAMMFRLLFHRGEIEALRRDGGTSSCDDKRSQDCHLDFAVL